MRLRIRGNSCVSDILTSFGGGKLELELKDNSGRVYDFIDLSNIAYSSLEKKILFDTHGWSKSNIKLQKRAEKFVEYYSQSENADKLSQINISINPFNWFNYNAVKSLKRNDENKAKILKNAYAKRMANVLFTFTPLLNDKNFDVIVRAFPDSTVGKFANGYRESDMNDITHNILSNLAKLYVMDLNGENKVIKSKNDYCNFIKSRVRTIYIPMLIWAFPWLCLKIISAHSLLKLGYSLILYFIGGLSILYFIAQKSF